MSGVVFVEHEAFDGDVVGDFGEGWAPGGWVEGHLGRGLLVLLLGRDLGWWVEWSGGGRGSGGQTRELLDGYEIEESRKHSSRYQLTARKLRWMNKRQRQELTP